MRRSTNRRASGALTATDFMARSKTGGDGGYRYFSAAMSRDAVAAGGRPVSELRVDGGACVNNLLMQFQADLLGIPVVRPEVVETTALGAAYLAGLATGVYPDTTTIARLWRAERTFVSR